MAILLPPLLSADGFFIADLMMLLLYGHISSSSIVYCTEGVGVCVKVKMMVMDEVMLWKTQSSPKLN